MLFLEFSLIVILSSSLFLFSIYVSSLVLLCFQNKLSEWSLELWGLIHEAIIENHVIKFLVNKLHALLETKSINKQFLN